MSKFSVSVTTINDITPIDGADNIEVAHIGGYNCVVQKGIYKKNDMAVYIPVNSILPPWIISSLGLEGKLSGPEKNRVSEIKLRGILSTGLLYPVQKSKTPKADIMFIFGENMSQFFVNQDTDVTAFLGIAKYEPEIPVSMRGEYFYNDTIISPSFDIENIKKHQNILHKNEEVVIDEKIHGTQTVFHFSPEIDERTFFGHWFVSSKGMFGKRNFFYCSKKNKDKNVYVRVAFKNNLFEKFERAAKEMNISASYTIFGETFGKGIQDLSYDQSLSFRGFAVWVEEKDDNKNGYYLDYEDKVNFFKIAGVEMVPVLYVGPYSKEIVEYYTNGLETVSGKETHIREGVVITPTKNRYDPTIGRVILKSISEDYLLRNGKPTEYN